MFIEILSCFCILFTFTLLIYWPFINYFKRTPFIERTIPYVIGLKFGLTGLLLTFSVISLDYDFMVHFWFISIIFSGLLGGPIALLISAFIMGIGRFFLPGLTEVGILLSINFFLLVILLFFTTRKYELNEKTVFTYFWACFIEINIVLFLAICFTSKDFEYLALYGAFTIFSFYFIYIVIHQVKRTNDTVQETTYLQKIDYLSQLPNTREIEKHIQQLIKKNATFNLLLIDIRDFKMINSQFGFSTGDSIIKQLAFLLEEYAIKNDTFVGRLSGEEFIIILKDTPPAIAIVEANILMKMIAKQSFEGPENADVRISVSVGISTYPDNGTNITSLMNSLIIAEQHAKANSSSNYFHANNLRKTHLEEK